MKLRYLAALTVALSISAPAFAADKIVTLFKDSTCNNCHAPLRDMAGPSIKSIASKYKGDKGAQAMLEKKVREGGSGTWGAMSMPATAATVSDENVKTLVTWMLSQEGEALFKQSNCGTCHAADKKLVGPSLKNISAKYAGDKEAQNKLQLKVRNGGSGSFGSMAMPATDKSVSDESIYSIVEWILTQPTTPSAEPKEEAKESKKAKTDKKAK